MTASDDPFTRYDAAYVLGALTPRDRRDYQAHLHGCPSCAAAVVELAGLPGLLGRVPADLAAALVNDAPTAPDATLSGAVDASRTRRPTRRLRVALASGLAVAVAAVAAVLLAVGHDGPAPGGRPVAMTAVRPTPVEATFWLDRVAWGTQIRLRCTYVGAAPPGRGPYDRAVYRLVVAARGDGREQTVAQWGVQPGQDAVIAGSTDLDPRQIGHLRLETVGGTLLLEAEPNS